MNTPIRGRTIARQQGRIVIRTAMGTQMSFEDNGLPLFIPVMVLYDYTTNKIKDVVEDIIAPREELAPEDVEDIITDEEPIPEPMNNTDNILIDTETQPFDEDDWD